MDRTQLVHRLVRDCMTQNLVTLDPYASLTSALEAMVENELRHVPVVERGRLAGIVTWTDVLASRAADPSRRQPRSEATDDLDAITVSVAMTADPITVRANETLGYAAEIMLEHKIGCLPVLHADRELIGLVTESNIFRAIARQWRDDNAIFSGARPSTTD